MCSGLRKTDELIESPVLIAPVYTVADQLTTDDCLLSFAEASETIWLSKDGSLSTECRLLFANPIHTLRMSSKIVNIFNVGQAKRMLSTHAVAFVVE